MCDRSLFYIERKIAIAKSNLLLYSSTAANFKGYKGSDPFNCQILNTNAEATVSHTQEKDKIIPAKGTVCQ
jgi:hypothetical protein